MVVPWAQACLKAPGCLAGVWGSVCVGGCGPPISRFGGAGWLVEGGCSIGGVRHSDFLFSFGVWMPTGPTRSLFGPPHPPGLVLVR